MPVVDAPDWGGVKAQTNLLYGAAQSANSQGISLKMAALQIEMRKREQIYALLRDIAKRRAEEKAAKEASKGSWGGLIGAGGGAIAGLALAPFTAGGSLGLTAAGATALNAGMGAGFGGAIGSGVDQAMGGKASNLGSNLMDFSTGFARMGSVGGSNLNPFYQAASQANANMPMPYGGGDGGWKDSWQN